MRRFEDADGRRWDVVLGRESWGALYALFVPAGHDSPIRQAMLDAAGYDAGQRELEELGADELASLFSRAAVKEG
jgi:hypothetical protein